MSTLDDKVSPTTWESKYWHFQILTDLPIAVAAWLFQLLRQIFLVAKPVNMMSNLTGKNCLDDRAARTVGKSVNRVGRLR